MALCTASGGCTRRMPASMSCSPPTTTRTIASRQWVRATARGNNRVCEDAIRAGIATEDFFGFASARPGGDYLGFAFGCSTNPALCDAALLIEREAARGHAPPQERDADKDAGVGAESTTTAGAGRAHRAGTGATTGAGVRPSGIREMEPVHRRQPATSMPR